MNGRFVGPGANEKMKEDVTGGEYTVYQKVKRNQRTLGLRKSPGGQCVRNMPSAVSTVVLEPSV